MGGGQNPVSETRQTTNWSDLTQGGSGLDTEYHGFTGTWAIGANPPAATPPIKPYWNVDGINGSLMLQIVEANVGAATVQVEGSYDSTYWFNVGYYVIVSADAAQATLTRAVAGLAVAQNGVYVLQLLDAYPLLRARPSTNAGSLTAGLYAIPA